MMSAATVPKLYRSVIEDVINSVRDMFLDDGVDEQVLIDLKQTWYKKVEETKALIDENNKDKGASTTGASSNSSLSTTTTITPATRPVTTQQPHVTTVISSNPSRHITTGSSALSTQTQITQVITSNQPRPLTSGGSSLSQPAQITQVITSTQPRQLNTGTTLGQQTQITPVITTNPTRHITTGSSALPQQLSFPQTVLQFPSGDRIDGSKSVPQKVFFLNTQTPGLMSSSAATASLALPPELANSILQQATFGSGTVINIQSAQPQESVVRHTSNPTSVINGPTTIQFQPAATNSVNQRTTRPPQPNSSGTNTNIVQLDGPNDNSSDEDDDDDEFRDNDDDHDDNDEDQNDDENEYTGEEEEPLNSEDDVSDEDPHELFDTDNVVVCQYDKITRSRNKWKFHLKDGIMNLQGKDYVFQKAIGDAEW